MKTNNRFDLTLLSICKKIKISKDKVFAKNTLSESIKSFFFEILMRIQIIINNICKIEFNLNFNRYFLGDVIFLKAFMNINLWPLLVNNKIKKLQRSQRTENVIINIRLVFDFSAGK